MFSVEKLPGTFTPQPGEFRDLERMAVAKPQPDKPNQGHRLRKGMNHGSLKQKFSQVAMESKSKNSKID